MIATRRTLKIFSNEECSIKLVESIQLKHNKLDSLNYLSGSISPIAIIVQKDDQTYAYDMDANPVELDALIHHKQKAPDSRD